MLGGELGRSRFWKGPECKHLCSMWMFSQKHSSANRGAKMSGFVNVRSLIFLILLVGSWTKSTWQQGWRLHMSWIALFSLIIKIFPPGSITVAPLSWNLRMPPIISGSSCQLTHGQQKRDGDFGVDRFWLSREKKADTLNGREEFEQNSR